MRRRQNGIAMKKLADGKAGAWICGLGAFVAISCSAASLDPRQLVEQGERAFQSGSFAEASANWEKAAAQFHNDRSTDSEIRTQLSLAGAYQALGQHQRASLLLENAVSEAEKLGEPSLTAQSKSELGSALMMKRDYERAGVLLQEALAAAEAQHDAQMKAKVLNDLGNLYTVQREYPKAASAFEESIKLAREAANLALVAQALLNFAAGSVASGDFAKADSLNGQALREIAPFESSHRKAFLLLTSAQTDRRIRSDDPEGTKKTTLRAYQSLRQALEIAEGKTDHFAETYALGYMAEMYDADKQPEAALTLSRRAAFAAQQQQITEASYRWESQTARLLKSKGDSEAAIAAYRGAIQTLQSIRNDVSLGYGNNLNYRPFRESEGQVFLNLADLLLEKSKSVSDASEEQKLLREARDTVEQMKSVELEAYFCDDCVDIQRAKTQAVEQVDGQTAVVYLVSLPGRTEILVGLKSGLKRFSVNVGADALTAEVRNFRRNLETRTSYAYLTQAQQLYDWLIRPIRPFLQQAGIKTLVFVPDGAMRTIPFSSLSDGEHYLIEDLAIGVVPGLSMVDPKPIDLKRSRILLNGLSEEVQGFAGLAFVKDELENIGKDYPSETLLNETFTLASLQHKMTGEQFSIVHIASHGKFDRDARRTFVLTHDAKLTLNDLEAAIRPSQYRGRPVELLVLSACQTAAGDDRAALGLAGVALKAGARSALATLWFVNDQSTSELIAEVYHQLQQTPRVSKAQALQAAQIKLLNDRRYRHPCYWSPYLIIGNWL
jgi:CHAT domain-containing protein